jgi:hypothetical protein
MDPLSAWKAFVAWFQDVHKAMIAFTVLAGCALFFPWKWLVAMRVESIVGSYRPLEWLVFALGSCLLALTGIESVYKRIKSSREIDQRLRQMSGMERGTVSQILLGHQIIKWPYEEGVVHLYKDGILWREDSSLNGQYFYGLEKVARKRANALKIGQKK